MRLCVPIPCFFPKMDFADALRRVKALGFDAAEGYDWRGFDFAAVRRALDETGVELLSLCTTEFRMTDPSFRGAWLNGLRESCAAARMLGVRRLITQVGPDTGAPRAGQHESIVQALKAARPILEDSGATSSVFTSPRGQPSFQRCRGVRMTTGFPAYISRRPFIR